MPNKYANLTGTNRISDEYELINEGFDGVQTDVQSLETEATAAAAHAANTNNPHNTSKAQVGLGNVDNYATATQAQATTGTATNAFMTPERTKQAITALAPATAPVQSVAGKTGNVTLNADDIAETTNGKILTAAERTKLATVAANAEPNQNAFATINGIAATAKQDTITFKGGTGIAVTQNPTTKEVTVTATGTSTPGAHASSHLTGGSDPISVATTAQDGLMSAAQVTLLNAKLAADSPAATGTFSLDGRSFSRVLGRKSTLNSSPHQKIDIEIPKHTFSGYFDISVGGGYDVASASGIVKKRFYGMFSIGGSIHGFASKYIEVAGAIGISARIGELAFDAAKDKYIIKVSIAVNWTAPEHIYVTIDGINTNKNTNSPNVISAISGITISDFYADSVVLPNPQISMESLALTAPQGTAPLNVTSTTVVPNFNSQLHNGWRIYNSYAELSIANNSGMQAIFNAMANYSISNIIVDINNYAALGLTDVDYGLLKIEKISASRSLANFNPVSLLSKPRIGVFDNTGTWIGWSIIEDRNYVDSRTRYGITAGTATALTLTLNPAPASLYTGLQVTVKLHVAAGTNPTLNVNGLGAKALYDADGARFSGESGKIYTFVYDGSNFIQSNGGGGAKLNVYTGTTQPTKKEGVWINTATAITSIRNDLDIWLANAWSGVSYTDVPQALKYHAAVENGGYVYLLGGVNTGGTTLNTLYRYNPSTNTWTTLANMPTALVRHAACAVGGKIYVFGGSSPSTISDTTYSYDIAANTWTTLANMPAQAYAQSVATVGNKVYLMGGYISMAASSANYCYDISTNTWTTLASLPVARYGHKAAAVGSKVYVFAGFNGSGITTITHIYDTVANSWSTGTNMPYAAQEYACVTVGNSIYVSGGTGALVNYPSAVDRSDFYVYNTVSNTWTALTSMGANRGAHSMVFANGLLFIMGGMVTSTTTSASVIAYAITSSSYPAGTVILYRTSAAYGQWQTELVTPAKPLLGTNTRMLSHFDDVYVHDGTTLRGDLPSYYGNGSAWVKFKN